MNDQDTIFADEKLLALYAALPDNLKEAIFSVNVADKIMKAGQKYGLNIEQIGTLAEATGLVMLGALHPRSYIQKLEETLGIERTKAIDIAKEINHEVFFPIREALKNIHHMEDTQEIAGEKEIEKGDAIKTLQEREQPQRVPSAGLGQIPSSPLPQKPLQPSQPQPPAKPPQQPSPVLPSRAATPAIEEKLKPSPAPGAVKPPVTSHIEPPAVSAIEPRRALFEKFGHPTAKKTETPLPAVSAIEPPAPHKTEQLVTRVAKPPAVSAIEPQAPSAERAPVPSWAKPPERTEKPTKQLVRQQPQKIPMQEIQAQTGMAPLKIESKQNQPVQKISMQEIRPRPAPLAEQKPGPKGDRYREPIDD